MAAPACSEIRTLVPGAPIELRPEPKNKHDPCAVAVIAPSGICIGYLSAERCGSIRGKIVVGDEVPAIFQEEQPPFAVIRIRLGGGAPTLPAPVAQPPADEPD